VITQLSVEDQRYFTRAREIFIRLTLIAVMGVTCFLLMRPFLNLILASIIIAIGVYPGYRIVTNALQGRANLAAALCTILLLVVMVLPAALLAGTLADGIGNIVHQVQEGKLSIPPPPSNLESVPLIGPRLNAFWTLCSTNLSEAVSRLGPQIKAAIPGLLAASAGIGGVVLQILIAIVIAGFLLANSKGSGRFAERVFVRIFWQQGAEYKELVSATVRSVTNGILGVAVIQTLFASAGFWMVGLPGAGLWAILFLVAAVLQVGVIVLIPAVLYVFAADSTTHAVIFLAWCIVVGLMDNVLKPILLGRGSKVPTLVIFIGVLGGFVLMNIMGLFVGAIVLSVGYKLFMAWLGDEVPEPIAADDPHPVQV
jgi:predicted PurR-regulated permease PerM